MTAHTIFGALCLLVLAGAAPAEARKLAVATNGNDAVDCGGKKAPCRSISQAIANAAPGDMIVVGPGRYGDLNRDGALGGPGEEHGTVGRAVTVDKPVTIVASAGAGATTIDGGGNVVYVVFFVVGSEGARLGARKKGFTIVGSGPSDSDGVGTDSDSRGVTLEGNRAVGHGGEGFEICGRDHRVLGNWALANGQDGIELNTGDNVAIGNVAARNGSAGIALYDERQTVSGNQVNANVSAGIEIAGAAPDGMTVTRNVVTGNVGPGVLIGGGGGHVVTGNAIIGNAQAGVAIHASATVRALAKNAIYGNDDAGGGNCGVDNQTAQAIDAPQNFWGLAAGPGLDPADTTCGDLVATAPALGREGRVRVRTPQ